MKQDNIIFRFYSTGIFAPTKTEQYKTHNYFAQMNGRQYTIMAIKELENIFINTGKKYYRFHPVFENKSVSRLANSIFCAAIKNGLL